MGFWKKYVFIGLDAYQQLCKRWKQWIQPKKKGLLSRELSKKEKKRIALQGLLLTATTLDIEMNKALKELRELRKEKANLTAEVDTLRATILTQSLQMVEPQKELSKIKEEQETLIVVFGEWKQKAINRQVAMKLIVSDAKNKRKLNHEA
ncbi:unnamed protein product [Caretta caretta]